MEDEKWLFDTLYKIPNATKQELVAGLALVGSAYLAYEEQQKAQKEQLKQNEDILEIRKLLAEMKEERKRQKEEQIRQIESIRQEKERQIEKIRQERQQETAKIQQERKDWEAEQTSYRECLKALQRQVQERDQAMQNVKTQLTELQDRFHNQENDNKAARERLEQENETALTNVKNEYQEIRTNWLLYKKYKTWIAENSSKIHLNHLDCSRFETFISCCGQKKILLYIFDELSSVELWDWEQEDIAILDEVIDCCCILQKLDRADPRGPYDAAYHYKQENAPSNGHIVRVLLRGVCVNGNILEDCKSFVALSVD